MTPYEVKLILTILLAILVYIISTAWKSEGYGMVAFAITALIIVAVKQGLLNG